MPFPGPAFAWLLAPALVLWPVFGSPPARDTGPDLEALRRTECQYQGIETTFEELTRAYVLQVYEGGALLGWEAVPSPQNPDTETLVTARFAASGLKALDQEPDALTARLRQAALPGFGVTWRYSTLAATRIAPHNEYARDALAVYQQTIEGFIARMVVVRLPAALRQEPASQAPALAELAAGTVLLEEHSRQGWTRARLPSSTLAGWIEEENLYKLDHVR